MNADFSPEGWFCEPEGWFVEIDPLTAAMED